MQFRGIRDSTVFSRFRSLLDFDVIVVCLSQGRVVVGSPFWEQLRVVVVGRRGSVLTVRQLLWNHVDVVERDLPLVAQSEVDLSLHLGVDCLVEAYDDIVT